MSEKLQKVLARGGFGSRRELETWIIEGRITVNGKVATLGDRVTEKDRLQLDNRPILMHRDTVIPTRVLMYHKPVGEICSRQDPEGRGSVYDHLPEIKNGRWISIGRLDVQTSGLLLFTNNGELANFLMHPKQQFEREYAVRVLGKADESVLTTLTQGVMLEDGMARFEHVVDGGGKGVNHWYYVVVTEGRNRVVRRLWESQGMAVNRLKRVRFGPIILGSMPRQGQTLELSEKDIQKLSPPASAGN